MSVLDRITPQQRKLLLYGIPAVAVLALGLRLGRGTKSDTSSTDTPAAAPITGGIAAPLFTGSQTDVLGVGQLADFETVVAGAIGKLGDQVNELAKKEPPAPCIPPIYPTFKSGRPTDCACPQGMHLIDDAANDRYSCASTTDYENFKRLVENIRAGRPPY